MDFLKTILIILLIYFGLRILLRLLAPVMLKYLSRRMEKKFAEGFGFNRPPQEQNAQEEGETIVDRQPPIKSKSAPKVGEYIDFEEID